MAVNLNETQREQIADACDAAFDFGETWIRFLRNGDESMLLPVIADLLADAWAEGHRAALDGVFPLRPEDNPYRGGAA
jgi:hypothetical protein